MQHAPLILTCAGLRNERLSPNPWMIAEWPHHRCLHLTSENDLGCEHGALNAVGMTWFTIYIYMYLHILFFWAGERPMLRLIPGAKSWNLCCWTAAAPQAWPCFWSLCKGRWLWLKAGIEQLAVDKALSGQTSQQLLLKSDPNPKIYPTFR